MRSAVTSARPRCMQSFCKQFRQSREEPVPGSVKNRACRILALIAFLVFAPRPAAAQTTLTDTVSFSFGENGGVVLTPTPGTMINAGYVKVLASPSQTPAMLEVLGFQSGGTLVSETVFPS